MRCYQVQDVMTADPMTVTPATPLKNVADLLVRGRIGVVPVLTPQGRVAGVVAEGDLLRKEQLQRDPDGRHSAHLPYRIRRDIATAETAGELMDRYPATAAADTSVPEAARLMDRHETRFLLVTSEDGKLLGVVTARDLLRVFPRPDGAIDVESPLGNAIDDIRTEASPSATGSEGTQPAPAADLGPGGQGRRLLVFRHPAR
jgi:CBS domain-containing protein